MVKEFEELLDYDMYAEDIDADITYYQIVEQAKKDAWNAAIRWAAENAEVLPSDDFYSGIDKQSILNGLID